MEANNTNEAFITGIDAGGSSNLLEQVRQDNTKMKQIVGAFSNKVETLIEKQRNEYIQAYESHMQEVQKELHSLREKVADIANDETKNEVQTVPSMASRRLSRLFSDGTGSWISMSTRPCLRSKGSNSEGSVVKTACSVRR